MIRAGISYYLPNRREKTIRGLTGSIAILVAVFMPATVAHATTGHPDPIMVAQHHFEQLESYQLRIHSQSALGDSTIIRYSYLKPGYVRMDFVEPHSGAALAYNPVSGKVRLWPFGMGMLPVLSLLPTNSLIRDKSGHRVDQSDIGVLLGNIQRLQQGGKTVVVGEEKLGQQPVLHMSITGPAGISVDNVHRYDIWLENDQNFPVKVMSYDASEQLLETVVMDAMVVNLHFPAHFFIP